ncbi:class I SAM-dependent methyltransferase [Paenibacillus sp. YPG26]|uniref:class I SAM-dependent methyltransferase n=1 Tax=Paenibacillus sp. YPG26 TaxID=2878915 RepID=UPI00203D2AB6|nr:class I SAM-dependent methyltransferase [Paenibacillus sp. YPG26]USB34876.1 class I SAM-dependent methyltransferase [Paenibacillus sp. YPG26]
MIITTGDNEASGTVSRAAALSQELGVPYVPRSRTSLSKLISRHQADAVLVILERGIRIVSAEGEPLEFHPSMSFVRAKRLMRGEPDHMLEVSRAKRGDSIIDCTSGLGSDSIIFSLAVGEEGSVTALESSLPIYGLLKEGLTTYQSGLKEFDKAMRHIEVKHADHLQLLGKLPDKSMDIVYFDPMFREPVKESSSISPLRTFANGSPLDSRSIEEACRVARKTVVLKEKRDSGEFARLGFTVHERAHTKIAYGVITLDNR